MNDNLIIWLAGCIVLFTIALHGLMSQKDGVKLVISIEILVTAVNSVFIGIGYLLYPDVDPLAQTFTILSLAVGGAIIGIALNILKTKYQLNNTVDVSKGIQLRW